MNILVLRGYLVSVAMIFNHIRSSGALITCEAGTFVVGKPASITCKFRTNITATQRAINMALYPPEAPQQAIGKDILLCRWLTEQQDYGCHLEETGYTFDHVLTDRLTVKVPEVRYDMAGLYMCFFLPSVDTETHPCELNVVEDLGEAQQGLNLVLIIVPSACGLVAVIIIIVGVVICLRRRRNKRKRGTKAALPLLESKGQTIEEHLQAFQLTKAKLQLLFNDMKQDLKKPLDDSTRLSAGIKMPPTVVTNLPDGSETGEILVLAFDGDSLELFIVRLQANGAKVIKTDRCHVPATLKGDTAQQLFYFVADKTNDFIKNVDISSDSLPLAFLVAFPCQHESLDKARLTMWTKETHFKGCENQDIRGLLEEALTQRRRKKRLTYHGFDHLNKLKIVAVVNDAVGTLMSVAHGNTNCKICLIVDAGVNACYVEHRPHVEDEKPQEMIINTELGALGENGCLDFCRTEFDRELDKHTQSPGQQLLEKMVGGRYIGEIVRLMLAGLTKEGLLFPAVPSRSALFEKDRFSTESVIQIESDSQQSYQKTKGVLEMLGLNNYTDDDLQTVRRVCKTVCERAAFLSAASLATLINHVNQPEVTVVVDGYLYQVHPRFYDLMRSKTLELVKPGLKFWLVSPYHPKCVGAARIAAASLRQQDPHTVQA